VPIIEAKPENLFLCDTTSSTPLVAQRYTVMALGGSGTIDEDDASAGCFFALDVIDDDNDGTLDAVVGYFTDTVFSAP